MRQFLPLLLALSLFASGCYEDRVACFDPDAANFDVRADENCNDCCQYPNFNLRISRVYGNSPFLLDSTYVDGAGNDFRITRLRFYLSDFQLSAGEGSLPEIENLVEFQQVVGVGDTAQVALNDNTALITTSSGSGPVGSFRGGKDSLISLSGLIGVPAELGSIVPTTAPASSPLSTQPGLLNFNDGQGYLQASLEYQLGNDSIIMRSDVYGTQFFALPFPSIQAPQRGTPITVTLEVDYGVLFSGIDLRSNPALFADALPQALRITEVR